MKRLIHTSRATYCAVWTDFSIDVYEKKRFWIFPYRKFIGSTWISEVEPEDIIRDHEERLTQTALLKNAMHE